MAVLPAPPIRILVVEDETMLAVLIEEVLAGLGYAVVGPAGRLDVALKLALEETFSAAILDVTIRGGDVFPVALVLRERSIPFVLASGYGAWAIPQDFKGQALLSKPYTVGELEKALAKMLAPV